MEHLNSATRPQGHAPSASSHQCSTFNFLSLLLMLGLWLHTPLVRGQVHFEPPLALEFYGGSPSNTQNSGTEFLVYQSEQLIANVYDGTVPEVFFNWGFFAISGSYPLGVDIASSTSVVVDIEDPDISGYSENLGVARFLIVYEGLEAIDFTKHLWFEVYEFNGITFDQIIPPSPLTRAALTNCYSPNVDVDNMSQKAAIVYNLNDSLFFKATDLSQGIPLIQDDLDQTIGSSNNGAFICDNCPNMGAEAWVDVSLTPFRRLLGGILVHDPKVHIAHLYDINNLLAVKSGDFDTIFKASENGDILRYNHEISFDCVVSGSSGLGFGPPRIASHGETFGGGGPFVQYDYAVVYTDYMPNDENLIKLSVGNTQTCNIYNVDAVNTRTHTDRCYNGEPVVTYYNDNRLILVAWSFNDCDNCINFDMDCPPATPPYWMNEWAILGKHYDEFGNRVFGNIISVADWPYYDFRNAKVPSIAASNYKYTDHSGIPGTPEVLLAYDGIDHTHFLNKISPWAGGPELKPGREDALSVEEGGKTSEIQLVKTLINRGENLSLQVNGSHNLTAYEVLDIQGKQLLYQTIGHNQEVGENTILLEKSGGFLESGVYFLRVYAENKLHVFKFVSIN